MNLPGSRKWQVYKGLAVFSSTARMPHAWPAGMKKSWGSNWKLIRMAMATTAFSRPGMRRHPFCVKTPCSPSIKPGSLWPKRAGASCSIYGWTNLHDFLERLHVAGVQVEERILEWERGKHGWIRDLDGNRLEIYEEVFPES